MGTNNWQTFNLEDVLEALIDYRGKTPQKTSSGIPLITAKIVKNGFIQEPDEFIAEEAYDEWMVRGLPQVGDVVLTTEAPLGEVAQIRDNRVALAQRIVTLRGKRGVLDNGYLKYFLQSGIGQARLQERETGTTVTGIKQSELRLVKIDLPSFDIQQRIATILSALDDKIELNRQTNATLEAIAQAIFQEWFVDFRFPGASGEMYESELGMIPQGWRVSRLGEVGDFRNGINYTRDENGDTAFAIVNVRDIVESKFINKQNLDTVKIDLQKAFFYLLKAHDILIVRSASPGETAILLSPEEDVIYSGFTIRYRLFTQELFLYMFFILQSLKEKFYRLSDGTTLKNINQGLLRSYQVIIPDNNSIELFNKEIEGIYGSVLVCQQQSFLLTQIRDHLLPKLMNGEIEV